MSLERALELVERFRRRVREHVPREPRPEWDLEPTLGRDLLESMLLARHLDLQAHELRRKSQGYFTICSTGHEANVVLGRLTFPEDLALLHYRSAALVLERARHVSGMDAVRDIALSLVASREEPTSAGRHKVFGHRDLGIIPKTSTIASHVPRAVGLAFGLERRRRLGLASPAPRDAIVLVTMGDASLCHSTALGALNAVSWTLHQNLELPLLVVCEDNGLGISVRTPEGWVETRLRQLPHFRYFEADGVDLCRTYRAASAAVGYCRRSRKAAVLHLRCVRLLGHSGSDVDTAYRSPAELEAAVERDPILHAALDLIDAGAATPRELLDLEDRVRLRVEAEAERAPTRPKIGSRAEVVEALVTPVTAAVGDRALSLRRSHGAEPLTLAQGIHAALEELLDAVPEALIFGQDVAKKGGVYGVTKGLFAKAGPLRVFNTLLDEQTILGLGLGTATVGLFPIPEIQYLAYLHNAEDQLRGEASSTQFFSNRAYDNPMVVRIAGLPYQKGFGGHFHNDNSLGVLRDIPGLVILVPARADDALALYRTAFALGLEARRVVVAIEPIALYHTRDLHAPGDGLWMAREPGGDRSGDPSCDHDGCASFGRVRVYQPDAGDLVIATYGNGTWMSLRAAKRLEADTGRRARILDLRWISPLPEKEVLEHARQSGRLLVVDECRRTGNVSEALAAAVLDAGLEVKFARVAAADSFIPLGDAANLVLPSEDEIVDRARRLLES